MKEPEIDAVATAEHIVAAGDLAHRKVSKTYAELVNVAFETPTVPHLVLRNNGTEAEIIDQITSFRY